MNKMGSFDIEEAQEIESGKLSMIQEQLRWLTNWSFVPTRSAPNLRVSFLSPQSPAESQ
jgi:hypothetical protein